MENLFEILFNERTNKFSLWLNGKVIKLASKREPLEAEVERRGGTVEED